MNRKRMGFVGQSLLTSIRLMSSLTLPGEFVVSSALPLEKCRSVHGATHVPQSIAEGVTARWPSRLFSPVDARTASSRQCSASHLKHNSRIAPNRHPTYMSSP